MANSVPPARSEMPRRSFFGTLIAAGSALIGAVLGVPAALAALFPLRDAGSQTAWSDLGPLDSFTNIKSTAPITQPVSIERRDGWELATTQQTVYVVAGPGGRPSVFSSACPHLGCTVQWRAEKDQFICPCHGGTYAPDGSRVSGPPARGMDELPTRVQDGRLYVQFQYFRQLLASKEVVD